MIRPYIFRFRRFGFDSDLITRTFFEFFPCFWKTGIYLKISRLSCYCYFYVEWWFMNTFWGGYCKIWGNLLPEPPTPISLYATEYSRERRKSINFGKLRLKFENPIAILICGRARWQPCTIFLCPLLVALFASVKVDFLQQLIMRAVLSNFTSFRFTFVSLSTISEKKFVVHSKFWASTSEQRQTGTLIVLVLTK